MSKKCLGCGIELQDIDETKDGYVEDLIKVLFPLLVDPTKYIFLFLPYFFILAYKLSKL